MNWCGKCDGEIRKKKSHIMHAERWAMKMLFTSFWYREETSSLMRERCRDFSVIRWGISLLNLNIFNQSKPCNLKNLLYPQKHTTRYTSFVLPQSQRSHIKMQIKAADLTCKRTNQETKKVFMKAKRRFVLGTSWGNFAGNVTLDISQSFGCEMLSSLSRDMF